MSNEVSTCPECGEPPQKRDFSSEETVLECPNGHTWTEPNPDDNPNDFMPDL